MAEVRYCTVYDVAQILGVQVDRFDEASWPAKETVEMLITQMMDYVDRFTNTSWRIRKRWEDWDMGPEGYEYHRVQTKAWYGFAWLGHPIFLKRRKVQQFDRNLGDSLQVFNGREWEEWLGVKTEGINGDYWVNYDDGILYIRRLFWFSRTLGHVVRVRYRYGGGRVPEDVRYATALLVAAHLVESGDYNVLLPEGTTNIVFAINKVQMWREKAMDILERYREVMVVD